MIEPLVFLWPAFLVSVCLVGIHVYFGIQVLARQVIFVDLALAQIAALGATVAFMLGHSAQSPATYGYSLSFTLLAAVLLAFTRAWGTRVPQEALIGVIYVVAAAAAILLIDRAPQGAEHLKQILTGNILTSGWNEIAVIVKAYAPDPYRPQVRVLFDRTGSRLDLPYDVNLWDVESGQDRPSSVVAPLDPADYAIDPLALM